MSVQLTYHDGSVSRAQFCQFCERRLGNMDLFVRQWPEHAPDAGDGVPINPSTLRVRRVAMSQLAYRLL